VQVYGAEKLHQALQGRPKGKALLTVCIIFIVTRYSYVYPWEVNLKVFSYASSHVLFYLCNFHFQVSNHVAAMDDPFVIASLLPPSVMLEAQKLRWTLCATDRCFTNPVLSTFFRSVKVLPVSRGEGIYQKVSILLLSSI